MKIPGLKCVNNFITKDEEDNLISNIDSNPWLNELKRRVQHYGYKYDYTARKIDMSMYVGELPVEIAELHRDKKFTGIFVTHDQVEAMTMGDRIAVMNNGKIHQLDTPENVYKKPADTFVASFIGTPAMNLVSGKTVENQFVSELFAFPVNSEVQTVGFRPEHIETGEGEINFEAEVVQPELCGMDWVIHCRKGETKFSCRTKESMTPGTIRKFSLSTKHLHLFGPNAARLDV